MVSKSEKMKMKKSHITLKLFYSPLPVLVSPTIFFKKSDPHYTQFVRNFASLSSEWGTLPFLPLVPSKLFIFITFKGNASISLNFGAWGVHFNCKCRLMVYRLLNIHPIAGDVVKVCSDAIHFDHG